MPVLEGTADAFEGVARGGYVLVEEKAARPRSCWWERAAKSSCASTPPPCSAAGGRRGAGPGGVAAVVGAVRRAGRRLPDEVLPPGVPTLAVEAASSFGWERYADDSVSIDHFGASAPGAVVLAHFGYTTDNVVARARALLARQAPTKEMSMTTSERSLRRSRARARGSTTSAATT